MAGAYVTNTRQLPPIQEEIGQVDPVTGGLVRSTDFNPYYFYPGGTLRYPARHNFNRFQETYSYRSVGSQLGPSLDEAAAQQARGNRDGYSTQVDNGHLFRTEKILRLTSHPRKSLTVVDPATSLVTGFNGPINLSPVSGGLGFNLDLPDLPGFDPTYYGNRLIGSAAPSAPSTTLLQTLAEALREGVTLPGKASLNLFHDNNFLRSAGGEYLNLAFGWGPLMSDLQEICQNVLKVQSIVDEMKNNTGRLVRRERGYPEAQTTTLLNGKAGVNMGGIRFDNSSTPYWWNSVPTNTGFPATIVKQTSERIWFNGAFTMYLNYGDTFSDRLERYSQYANKILGIRLTPDVLWELTPWSWLTDYFVDIGSALQTASLFQSDGLVLKYGYLMRETTQRVTITSEFAFKGETPSTYFTTYSRVKKERFKSTPFGFGLDLNGFTNRQWSILAALGLSRGPKSLY